ncbi:hypothetical protein GFH30_02875 [Acinetobacter wanghuae]|uniref:DUF342 domain-containing protein n=1 Tax=Acinetobacter wanghuae TaxID=2662362 RepID=A0A5Q0P0W7_9GAMM|nr:hypothetical protein [Acinetobacter wanghuae]MQW93170.1 hypothetical protein [Acinetobacter wanghuae]QGA10404.1 hypothetical protein GFH30_02875 [Acinetobacter wanghuae]
MQTFKKQNGMATILLVLLIGITVMLITASVARALMTKKEAATAAHAQTNAQILGWAGVSAFREYLTKKGSENFKNIQQLSGQNITLKYSDNHKVNATVTKIIGCHTAGGTCTVIADIAANNSSAQAATTITVTYDITIVNGSVNVVDQAIQASLGGNVHFSGNTIKTELPNSKVTINVDGNVAILADFKLENISELTINSKGNIDINCIASECEKFRNVHLNAKGSVTIHEGIITKPAQFGNISAEGDVTLQTHVHAQNVKTLGKVYIATSSSAQNIDAVGQVKLYQSQTSANINSNNDVILILSSSANNINARNVQIGTELGGGNTVKGNIIARGWVEVGNSLLLDGNNTVQGNIYASNYVKVGRGIQLRSKVLGSIQSNQYIHLDNAEATSESSQYLSAGTYIRLYNAEVKGSVYTKNGKIDADLSSDVRQSAYINGNIEISITSKIHGNAIYSGSINNITRIGGNRSKKTTAEILTYMKDHYVINMEPPVNSISIYNSINDLMNFGMLIDVKQYKLDANYIFQRSIGGFTRVYLNHLKNKVTGDIYIYGKNATTGAYEQQVIKNGSFSPIQENNGNPFYLADYGIDRVKPWWEIITLNRSGAICAQVNGKKCSSKIVGYLPRLDITRSSEGFTEDYHYDGSYYNLRSSSGISSLDNAAFAPGILYFDGPVTIAGALAGGNSKSTYTNTILAEGRISASATSPRIYSPYNILREKNDAAIICNRALKTADGSQDFSSLLPNTNPETISNVYLIPTNLCKNESEFSYSMDRDPSTGKILDVNIDDNNNISRLVPKLDLGYVALMSNDYIDIGTCTLIYGDTLARNKMKSHSIDAGCITKGGLVGNMSSQGYDKETNTFGTGFVYTIPKENHTGIKTETVTSTDTGIKVESTTSGWARYK